MASIVDAIDDVNKDVIDDPVSFRGWRNQEGGNEKATRFP